MIELPDFTEQSMYDSETYFSMQMTLERLAKFIVHYEAVKMTQNVPGAIVECGVFKGTSFIRFAKYRELLGNSFSRKLIAFDMFSDDFPESGHDEDEAQRKHWIDTAGSSSIAPEQLHSILNRFDIRNLDIVSGDCLLYTSPSPRDATLSRMPSSA